MQCGRVLPLAMSDKMDDHIQRSGAKKLQTFWNCRMYAPKEQSEFVSLSLQALNYARIDQFAFSRFVCVCVGSVC